MAIILKLYEARFRLMSECASAFCRNRPNKDSNVVCQDHAFGAFPFSVSKLAANRAFISAFMLRRFRTARIFN
nr:hypothetical protein [Burkholderia gladioli]